MKYAPVLIPTVNRYNHFKECIESLSRCTWADKTDVFVAVDYPGKEDHWEGYRKIRNYLEHCGNLGFNSLNVIYRETNYYFSGKSNLESLRKEVLKQYDRYICTEDDNFFSPNFLVYINKGLEKYENDESVYGIVGYTPPLSIKCPPNATFIRQNVDFYAWGYATWKQKELDKNMFFANRGFYNSLSLDNLRKMYKNGRYRFNLYLQLVGNKTGYKMSDNNYSIYIAIKDMDVVMPSLSLVRNKGWDDSGIHCPTTNRALADEIMNQTISNDSTFSFLGTGMEFYNENKDIFANNRERKDISLFTVFFTGFKTIIKRIVC